MPTYVYKNCCCEIPSDGGAFLTEFELNVPIDKRDHVYCGFCGRALKRKIVFTGLTWAPTAGGMR